MQILELPTSPFSVEQLQNLYRTGPRRDFMDASDYVFSYFNELPRGGGYYFYNQLKNIFELTTKDEFKSGVLDKIGDKTFTNVTKQNNRIFNVVSRIGKPRKYMENGSYFINEAGQFLHQTYKKYDDYDQDTKSSVELIINMMKELSCDNDENTLRYYLLYYSQLARGKKTQTIIYRKGIEGLGKSTETNFICEYVLGKQLAIMHNNAEPLTTQYNKILMGKLLVVFEELPTFSDSQWAGASSKLKSYATETTSIYRDLYEKAITADNITNFQINTNVNAIKDSNGRRYTILDFATKRKGDYAYFKNIQDKCYNNKTGEAFFSYLLTKITDEQSNAFLAERDFPETDNKLLAISNTLNSAYLFIKEEYILKNASIDKIKCKDFYMKYDVMMSGKRKMLQNEFYKKLEEIGINRKTSGQNIYYFCETKEFLLDLAKKNKWLCKYDNIVEEGPTQTSDMVADLVKVHEAEIEELNITINNSKLQVQHLQSEIDKLTTEKEQSQCGFLKCKTEMEEQILKLTKENEQLKRENNTKQINKSNVNVIEYLTSLKNYEIFNSVKFELLTKLRCLKNEMKKLIDNEEYKHTEKELKNHIPYFNDRHGINIDVDLLEESINEVIKNAEALYTQITKIRDEEVQKIDKVEKGKPSKKVEKTRKSGQKYLADEIIPCEQSQSEIVDMLQTIGGIRNSFPNKQENQISSDKQENQSSNEEQKSNEKPVKKKKNKLTVEM